MVNLGLIAFIVGVIGVLIAKVLGKTKVNPEIAELGVKAEAKKTEIAAVEAERATIKDRVTAEQANVTEEQKTDFWNKELGVKKDD